MSLYNISFYNKVIELLPVDKRQAINVRWLQSLASPIQYLRDKYLGDYKVGSDAPQWVAGTYAKGAKVVFKQVVYESLVDGNTDQPPTAKWMTYLPSFMGVDKRVLFNGQKLVLEYALNQRFLGTFRQPPLQSDIYITNNALGITYFRVGDIEAISSSVYSDNSTELVINSYDISVQYNFTIHIPSAIYSGYPSEIINFVSGLIPAGLTFNIVTY